MINYSDKDNIDKLILLEKNSLQATIDIQKTLNKQILVFMKNFIGNIEISADNDGENSAYMYLSKSTTVLNKSNTNISNIGKLLELLDNLQEATETLPQSKLISKIEAYNKKFSTTIDSTYKNTKKIEEFIHETSMLDLSTFLKENSKPEKSVKKENEEQTNTITSTDLESGFIEKTLIISDIQKKVILPYKLDKIEDILLANSAKYKSLQDVIDKLYTRPIKYYKAPAIARFKESYRLMRKKEHSSILKALSLASELFMNYNLHPAIITACKNIDQLDIYLACLEDDTLDEFKFFDIKYEVAPKLT
ncbi:MAG: hypothetical protein IKF17_04990 [Clostridia bacterium]|nr:hypothetical protein [Clostridia bacterium]